MSSTELKSGISNLLKKVNDERFLRTVYAIMSEYTGIMEFDLSPSEKKLLDERKKSHQAGISKSYSVKQMKQLVLERLK